MKKFKIVIPVKWAYISENKYKVNPIIRAITVQFFNEDTLQIPFWIEHPLPNRDNFINYRLVSMSPRGGIKKAVKIDLNEEAITKLRCFVKHGFMKPFSLTLEVPPEVVQNIRDWQFYWRKEMDRGLTPDMAQQTNDNEHYKRHIERAATARDGDGSRGSRLGAKEDAKSKGTRANRETLPSKSGKKAGLRPKGKPSNPS